MNRLKKIIALALPLLFLSLIPLSLAPPPGMIPWKGTRINILFGRGKQIISSSDYSYVAHGWAPDDPWSEMSAEDRAFFMGPSLWFELETDPALPLHARPETFTYMEYDVVFRFWWYQFKPGDLTPGEYIFTGTWYWDYEVAPPVKHIKLIVTP